MKILKSFDTRIDAEEFLEAVNKYGEWNVILIKRHRVKLMIPLFLVFISMILEWVMLYSIYMHLFDEHKVVFWFLAIFYVYTTYSRCIYTIIWIIANVVYWMNTKKKYIDKVYKAEEKQKWFEKFMKRTFVTFLFHTLVLWWSWCRWNDQQRCFPFRGKQRVEPWRGRLHEECLS